MGFVTADPVIARKLAATYDFWGLHRELERTLPLQEGEEVDLSGAVRQRERWQVRRLGFLRLSAQRLCLLRHFDLRADQAWEVPLGALVAVASSGTWVELTVRFTGGDETIALRGWTGHRLAAPPLRIDRRDLAGRLSAWMARGN